MLMRKLTVDGDIASAKTLHKDFYTQPYYFEEAKEKIFGSCWNFAGDMDRLPEEGSCYPFFLLPGYLEEPLLLTKDKAGDIHCLSNVCTHRSKYNKVEGGDKLRLVRGNITVSRHGPSCQK